MLNIFTKKVTKKVNIYEIKWLDEEGVEKVDTIDAHGLTNMVYGLESCGCEVLSVERLTD